MLVQFVLFIILVANKNTCESRTKDEWNKIAHLFHSVNIKMRPVFREGNSTAGDIIIKQMEDAYEGLRQFKIYLETLDEYKFHKILEVVKFILLRGVKQFDAITYSKDDLKIKYFWEKDKVKEFRSLCRDIKDVISEIRANCEYRHVNLDDD